MAYSYSEHPNVGVGQTLPLGFLYEPTSTVRVLVDGVLVPESLYFWPTDSEITTKTGFPVGAVTKVERVTPLEDYVFQNGTSVYDFEGVNRNFQQILFSLQEYSDDEDRRNEQITYLYGAVAGGLTALDEAVEISNVNAAATLEYRNAAQLAASGAAQSETLALSYRDTALEARQTALSASGVSTTAAASAIASSTTAQDLVLAASAGFLGFQDGGAFDFGSITTPVTYFDQDWGSI